jgi:hypothetical protein
MTESFGAKDCPGAARFLVRSPLLHRRGADAEVVEAFDGAFQQHGARKAGGVIGGEEKVGGSGWRLAGDVFQADWQSFTTVSSRAPERD